jgi:hypothetical protein
MQVFYYILGAFLFIVMSIVYSVIKLGGISLNVPTLIDYCVSGLIAGVAFFVADYLMAKK